MQKKWLNAAYLPLAFFFTICSCRRLQEPDLLPVPASQDPQRASSRETGDDDAGTLVLVTFRGQRITALKSGGNYYTEDDVVLPAKFVSNEAPYPVGLRSYPSAYSVVPVETWPGNDVPYVINSAISPGSPLYNHIIDALKYWNDNTYLRFHPVNAAANGVLEFVKIPKGCRSNVGYESNDVITCSLSDNCALHSVLHEIGHAIGLQHEHIRGIRDQYLDINADAMKFLQNDYKKGALWATIMNNVLERRDATINNRIVDDFPFDFESLMIYGSYPVNDLDLLDALKNHTPPLPFYTKLSDGSILPPPVGEELSQKDMLLVGKMYPPKLKLANYTTENMNIALVDNFLNNIPVTITPGNEIELVFNYEGRFWTYLNTNITDILLDKADPNDHVIRLIDAVQKPGQSGNHSGQIFYMAPFGSNAMPVITDFYHPQQSRYLETIDQKGVNGTGPTSISTYLSSDKDTYIVVSKWDETGSRYDNAARHLFDVNMIRTVTITNNTGITLPVKVRLEGTTDISENVANGNTLSFPLRWRNLKNRFSIFYNDKQVQEIDLNGNLSKSNDAISIQWSNIRDVISYLPSVDGTASDWSLISAEIALSPKTQGYFHGLIDVNGIKNIVPGPVYIKPEVGKSGTELNIKIIKY